MDMRALLEPKKNSKAKKFSEKAGNARENHVKDAAPSKPSTPSRPANQVNSHAINTSPSAVRTYDPRVLLNPRASKAGTRAQTMEVTGDPSNTSNGQSRRNGHANSGFNLLESLHGTEKRVEDRPAKRVKTKHDSEGDNKADGRQSGGSLHGNAGVGEYFKRTADPNIVGTTIPAAAIDLTNDDDGDDDDVQITGVKNADDKEVCYGMIDGYILAHKVPKPSKISNSSQFGPAHWPVFKVTLRRQTERGMTIDCTDPHGEMFGYVEQPLAEALAPAMDAFPKLRVQCRMLTRPQRKGEFVHQPCSDKFRVVINLYGKKGDVEKMGRWFGQKNIWFKSPMVSDAGVELQNPHARKRQPLPGTTSTGPHRVTNNTRTLEEASDAVSKLFDYQADENNELPETEPPETIVTPLLRHQKQALTFMLRQEQPRTFGSEEVENSSLWRIRYNHSRQKVYEEVVTGMQVAEEPEQCLGGLLADIMGLGKTIQALSLVANTMPQAAEFGNQKVVRQGEDELTLDCQSRATLLVAPVSTVKNWEDQIREHTRNGSMLYHVYHSNNRQRNPLLLADHDIVITTYGTAATEIFGKKKGQDQVSPLQRVRWFRIILDEAHTIRESKSSQARAMHALHAERRWCLTGTPIQNRIEDLGSLTIFLKLFPYNTPAGFNTYIKGPAQSGDTSFLKRLRVMVDSFTLRRLRDQIELPARQDLAIELLFSPEERKLHDFFREKYMMTVKEMTRSGKGRGTGGQYHRVLQGITVLRLICAHGKELLRESELEQFKGEAADEPIDIDDEASLLEIDQKAAYELFDMMVEANVDFCSRCGKHITGESPASPGIDAEDVTAADRAIVLPCRDVFCMECFKPYKPRFDASKGTGVGVQCPLQHGSDNLSPEYVSIPRDYIEQLQTAPEETIRSDTCLFKNGFYSGPHTKTKQLLNDLTQLKQDSMPLVERGEAPLKCVVFSEFTSHLDLIGKALTDHDHAFVRIDGSMSLPRRRKVLDALNEDDTVTILLASIKAAGQGLNLTAASRVFLMEPMWNPAAEAQAVDRVYRLGQKREVIVKRYRMQSSMEDKIVQLQNRKKKIAELSLEKKAMQKELSKKERNEQSLKAMLDFFKA
ncbi:hypothetical protein LTS08_001056 [Lithohypha guttulata]|nr:hypothetical protein LTS08_001056 [Lithohypha guttulata]